MKTLSIIIPVYNTERYVEQCLNSCVNQDMPVDDYEIIVVNDGTKDNSLEIVNQVASKHSNIMVVSQENAGLSAARNTGLRHAKGKYVWFVDSDDWIETNCLNRLVKRLKDDNLDGLVHAGIRYSEGVTTLGAEVSYPNVVMSGKELLSKHSINCAAVKTIYRRDFLLQNNLSFFEGIYHEDHEFTPRAYYFINRIEFVNDHVYYNRLTPGSITQKPNPKKAFDLITVARNLYAFKQSNSMVQQVAVAFNNLIAAAVNQSLSNTSYMGAREKEMLSKQLEDNKFLIESYIHSNNKTYRIEGWIFKLFPKRIVKVYSMLKR